MTWTRKRLAGRRATVEKLGDGRRAVAVAWVTTRHCGCLYSEGFRIDDGEPTFGVEACDLHEAQTRRAFDTFTKMPPSDEEAWRLWERLLDLEIEPHHAVGEHG